MPKKIRHQSPIKGGRKGMYTAVIKKIEERIRDDQVRFRASRSWVIASGLAAVYGIDIMSCWEDDAKRRRKLIRRVK
jgi:hypothetical protein